jgi:hypothetical protein
VSVIVAEERPKQVRFVEVQLDARTVGNGSKLAAGH